MNIALTREHIKLSICELRRIRRVIWMALATGKCINLSDGHSYLLQARFCIRLVKFKQITFQVFVVDEICIWRVFMRCCRGY